MTDAILAARPWADARPLRALPVLLVFFGLLTLFLALHGRLLNDPDTHWHIALGEQIWRTGLFPRTDELSHTFAGAPWIAKEWLSQVILYGAHAFAGWWGVTMLTALSAAAFLTLIFAWLRRRLAPLTAFALAGFAVILLAAHIVARPHIFSFPLLFLWLVGLTDAVERKASPPWWLVPLMAVWANLHASFPLAFIVAGLLALEAVDRAPAEARVRTAADWGIFGLAALLASGLTPYGYGPLLVSINLFGSGEAFGYISEWQPLGFDVIGMSAIVALLGSLALLADSPRQNLFRIAIVLLCGYLMVSHVRFVSLFGVVAAVVLAAPLARRFPGLRPQAAPAFSPGERIGAMACLAVLVAASVTLAALVRPAPNPLMAPAAALAAARELGVRGPLYNDYDFGGYLISEGVPTFIDGRADQIFLGGFMTDLYASAKSDDESRFAAFLDRYGVTWALVRPHSAEARLLDAAAEWSRMYADEIAAVYLKDAPERSTAP